MSLQLGFNNSYFTPSSKASTSQGIILARVTRVIYGPNKHNGEVDQEFKDNGEWASVGAILYTLLNSNEPVTTAKSPIALPYNASTKQYPVVGEIVQLVVGPSPKMNDRGSERLLYYLPPINLWNTPHHNAFPNPKDYADLIANADDNYKSIEEGATLNNVTGSINFPLGITFSEKSDIKSLQPYEGDTVIEGRWGQSIRFGSTVKSKVALNPWSSQGIEGSPITILRNGQASQTVKEAWINTVEDINNDPASIYLCSGQAIYMQDLNNFSLASYTSGQQLRRDEVQELNRQPISTDTVSPSKQSEFELNSNKRL